MDDFNFGSFLNSVANTGLALGTKYAQLELIGPQELELERRKLELKRTYLPQSSVNINSLLPWLMIGGAVVVVIALVK